MAGVWASLLNPASKLECGQSGLGGDLKPQEGALIWPGICLQPCQELAAAQAEGAQPSL